MRLFTGTIAAAALFVLVAAAPAQEAPRIVLIGPQAESGTPWAAVRKGAEAAAQVLGAMLEVTAPDGAAAEAVQTAVESGPDGIIAAIDDADRLAPAVRQTVGAGVPLVTIGEGFDVARQLGASLHVGQDDFEAGETAGAAMRRLGARAALCLTAAPASMAQDMRCKGVASAFDQPLALLMAGGDAAAVEAALAERLEADGAIDAVIDAAGGTAGEAALAAVAALDEPERVRLAGFDASPAFLEALAEGRAAFAVDQQPRLQGWLAVALLVEHARTGQMPVDNIRTGPRILDREAAQAMRAGE